MHEFSTLRTLRRCTRCVLPETFPGISFDEDGVCSVCRTAGPVESRGGSPALEEILDQAKSKNAPYDALLAFSGGKDSTFALWLLRKRFGLRVLAITVDNGFLSEGAIKNCRQVCDALEVDHQFFRPAKTFMDRMYATSLTGSMHPKAAIKRASAVCNSCISLINTHMLNTALDMGVSIVAGGYLAGQVPENLSASKVDPKVLGVARKTQDRLYAQALGEGWASYFQLRESDRTDDAPREIWIVNPLLVVEYTEAEALETIGTLGWARPTDTGANSSNCLLNDLGIASHVRRYGFHPYVAEMAALVRKGAITRDEALERLFAEPNRSEVKTLLARWGLGEDDL